MYEDRLSRTWTERLLAVRKAVGVWVVLLLLIGAGGIPGKENSGADGTTGFRGYAHPIGNPNRPLRDAIVQYSGPVQGTVRAGPDGWFVVKGIPPGTYRLTVRSRGFQPRTDASVVVVAEAVTQVGIPMQPLRGWRNPYVRSLMAIVAGGIILILVMMRNRVRSG